jgi:hypothetical protein
MSRIAGFERFTVGGAMNEFVFLYREPPQRAMSPAEMQARMQKWLSWFQDMTKRGHLAVYGQPLDRTGGAVVRGGVVSDGPYAETKDIVMGYSVIAAADLDEAIHLAQSHPIHDDGGMIEIRPVRKL